MKTVKPYLTGLYPLKPFLPFTLFRKIARKITPRFKLYHKGVRLFFERGSKWGLLVTTRPSCAFEIQSVQGFYYLEQIGKQWSCTFVNMYRRQQSHSIFNLTTEALRSGQFCGQCTWSIANSPLWYEILFCWLYQIGSCLNVLTLIVPEVQQGYCSNHVLWQGTISVECKQK